MNQPFKLDATALTPQIAENQTQIIMQRHCDYDKEDGVLTEESISRQKSILNQFISELRNRYTKEELQNTYFLFSSSNTSSKGNLKRALETTNIAMEMISEFLRDMEIPLGHIANLDQNGNYNSQVHEDRHLTEPKMFTDTSGYADYLKDKHGGINKEFWIDFEGDLSKEKREELGAEGPDEIVNRAVRYVKVLERYSIYFHKKNPNSRLIIWNGTHYDILSPFVKQKILNYDKTDIVQVENCGGLSIIVDEEGKEFVNANGTIYPIDLQYNPQLRLHF